MNTIEWLTRLISFDTTSRLSNLPLIDEIQKWFKEYKLITYLTYDKDEPKANIFATLPAADGNYQGGIIFSGHTDVVPVDGQDWLSNPFEATLRDEAIYGRGACDMKGFIAVILALIPEFKTLSLKKPIHFALSYDEEVGCKGIPYLLADLNKRGISPEGCIVGEPTNMRPVIAHKGRSTYKCRVHGHPAHSSLTQKGCNAIEYAALLIREIKHLAKQCEEQGPFDTAYDVPFTTLTTNQIKGGLAANVIPEWCEFILEIRNLPENDTQTFIQTLENYANKNVLSEMHLTYPAATIEFNALTQGQGLNATEDAYITKLVRALTGVKEKIKVSYGTEAGLFQRANIPTIICGPGSVEQAHQANEYVTIKQLKICETFIKNCVNEYALKLQ